MEGTQASTSSFVSTGDTPVTEPVARDGGIPVEEAEDQFIVPPPEINKITEEALPQNETEPVPLVIDYEVLEILGEDPSSAIKYGQEIHNEIARRFEYIAISGISKEDRKELMEKYLTPANCTLIGAPLLNPEIKAALSEPVIKRDKCIEAKQKQLATAVACLSEIISNQLKSQDKDAALIKQLMDTQNLSQDETSHCSH